MTDWTKLAACCTAIQETPVVTQLFKKIPNILRKPEVSSPSSQDPASFSILDQINPFHMPFQLTYLRSILILSFHLRLGGLLLSGVAIKTNFYSSLCVLRAQLSLPPWLYHPNYIWWRVKIVKLCIMLFPPAPFPLSSVQVSSSAPYSRIPSQLM